MFRNLSNLLDVKKAVTAVKKQFQIQIIQTHLLVMCLSIHLSIYKLFTLSVYLSML